MFPLKNLWFQALYGYVKIELSGKYVETVLNRLTNHKISIWSIKRMDERTVTFFIHLKDINQVRILMRRTGCQLRFIEKRGLPFYIKAIGKRTGVIIGIICFFLLFLIFSNVVFEVDINGASPDVEHKLGEKLREIGVKKGAFAFFLPSEQVIQQFISEEIDEVTWVGVKRKGTLYTFDVVEKTLPEEQEKVSPRHLVATKKAVIKKLFVEQGQVMVKEEDYVKKGDLLVSGIIGKEENEKIVPAKAEVFGEVWYLASASIPLKTTFVTNTGRQDTNHLLRIGSFSVPFWGFNKEEFTDYEVVRDEKIFYFINWRLPFTYVKETVFETERTERIYSKAEAVEVAKTMTKNDLLKKLRDDAEIIGEKVLQQNTHNGTVNVKIHYQVIEEISKEQAIIRGD